MRLMFCCAIAARLPSTIEAAATSISIICHSSAMSNSAQISRRTAIANAASLGAVAITSVTAVGAP
jgi:hypothetical protein